MKTRVTWILTAALALAVVVGISFYARDAKLKASDENVYAVEESSTEETAEDVSTLVLEVENEEESSEEEATDETEAEASDEAAAEEETGAAAEEETSSEVTEETETAEVTEEEISEEAEEEESAESEAEETEKTVYIVSDLEGVETVEEGTPITLTAVPEGFEGNVIFQWQRSLDGENWEDVPGATDMSYTFELTQETEVYLWRVLASEE